MSRRLPSPSIPLTFAFAVMLAIPALAQGQTTSSTTLATETANNTSASSTFKRQPNGNIGASSISKLPIQSLLYSGSDTKLLAHVVTWFGDPGHMDVGYNSSDATQIHKQVTDMLSRGIGGAVLDWNGPQNTLSTATVAGFKTESEAQNGAFTFAVMEDVNSVVTYSQQNGCDVTQKIIDDLNYAYSSFETSSAYMRQGGRPVVFFFGTEAYYVGWTKVQTSVSGNPVLVFRNAEAFPQAQATGAFSWMNIDASNPDDQDIADLDSLYSIAQQYPSKLTVGGAWKGFNDTLAAWSSNRVINQQCGRTWTATLAEAGKYYSSSNQLPYLQLVTWNDYEEGTEIETGIDDCVSLTPSMQNSTLSWSVGPNANENAVSKYRVFTSTDGQDLTARSDLSLGTHSLDLSPFGLQPNTTYTIYVQAIGKATIANHMSSALTYRPGHQPPTVSVNASPSTGTAPVAVTATVSATSASDSNIASISVDFGDGAVMSGSPVAHQYGNAGIHTITATATDTFGVSSSATTTATVTASASYGVAISSPSSGNVNDQFVDVKATATTPNPPITAMWVYVDSVVKYKSQNQSTIDASLKLDNGPHRIEVQAWDWTGTVFISDVDINVVAPSSTLTAVLDISPLSSFGQNGVMACTARTSDTNGFVTSSVIDFGDGSTGNGPTGLHNYSAAGTYNVKATVTDNHGFSAITTSSVTVGSHTDQPPIAKLSLSPNSGNVPFSVTASTAGSSDPDGTISSSRVDFGDGTVTNGTSAQHTYQASGTYTVTGTVTDNAGLSSTSSQTVSVGPLADNSAFVSQQYQDLLDRQPDSGGLNYYTNELNNRTFGRSQLIASFMSAPEFGSHGLFVVQVYVGIVARDADCGGFRWSLGVLDSTGSEEQLVNIFLQSQEFQSKFGSNLDNGQFVMLMFENILLRQPDQSGFNYYVGQLNNGTMTRAQVALSLLHSSEFQRLAASQNRVLVSLLYFDLLRREPDAGGFSYYVGQLNSGTHLTSIIDTFLDSGEYAARFK